VRCGGSNSLNLEVLDLAYQLMLPISCMVRCVVVTKHGDSSSDFARVDEFPLIASCNDDVVDIRSAVLLDKIEQSKVTCTERSIPSAIEEVAMEK